jgi:hypothetical protein
MLLSRYRVIVVVALAIAAMGLSGLRQDAQAAEVNHAGVVVRYGDGHMAYAYVSFTEDELNGIELLKRTGLDVVTVSFGGLGEGVCSIDEHGCPATDCRKRVCQGPKQDDPFWQYFRQTEPGAWASQILGASSTKVHDGDVDGWSWTGTESGLPEMTIERIAELSGAMDAGAGASPDTYTGTALKREGAVSIAGDQTSRLTVVAAFLIVLLAVAAVALIAIRRRAMPEPPP